MNQRIGGLTVYRVQETTIRPYRPRHWLPRREYWYYLLRRGRLLLLEWLPHHGLWCVSESLASDPGHSYVNYGRRPKALTMKRREALGLTGVPPVGAAPASVMLAKVPSLREWLTATTYDDGTARTPGALRLSTRNALWCATVTDPDAGARLLVSSDSLDKLLLLVEQLIGAAEAPWEIDPYATRTGQKKPKKK